MNFSISRSLLPLIGSISAVIILGCEGASAVATNPTPAAKCQPSVAVPPNVGAAGGLGALSLRTQPECAWNAATDVGWITDLSQSSGQGSGQLGFRAAPNTAPAARQGAIFTRATVFTSATACDTSTTCFTTAAVATVGTDATSWWSGPRR